jgi:lipid-A-disaccharide synthase
MKSACKIMIVAGEASGDAHAAKLVRELRRMLPDAEFFGAAGPKMRDAGVDAIIASDEMSIVGIIEIATALPMFYSTFRTLRSAALDRKPDVVVLIDFPEFNLKLAKSLKKRGFRIVYYISPQLWAWRQYRIKTIRESVDLLLTILPFEKEWYLQRGVGHATYVGNPLAREVVPEMVRDEFRRQQGIPSSATVVALLPGSRPKEIVRILPVLLETARVMSARDIALHFVIAAANDRCRDDISSIVAHFPDIMNVRVITGQTYSVLNAADVAAVTSGTATLETGIIGTPMAIVYKSSSLNYKLIKPLIDVEHYGLINLIAGERVARELIQGDLTPQTLADELARLLVPATNAEVRTKLQTASDKLGHGGASARAAEAIVELISN